MEPVGKIYQAIPAIIGELEAIGRNKRNEQQRFMYRGIDDLYNALSPLFAKHKVFTVPQVLDEKREMRTSKSGGTMTFVALRIKYTFYADDGSHFDAILIGEGMDSGDKASNKAESSAHKYALTQVFAVRTEDEKDPDGDSPGQPPRGNRPPQQNQRQGGPPPQQRPPQQQQPARPQAPAGNAPVQPVREGLSKVTEKQVHRLFAIANAKGYNRAAVTEFLQKTYGISNAEALPWTEYKNVCDHFLGLPGGMPEAEPTNRDAITEGQMKLLHGKGKAAGLDHDQLSDEASRRFGVDSLTDLTKKQASEFIELLIGFEKGRRA